MECVQTDTTVILQSRKFYTHTRTHSPMYARPHERRNKFEKYKTSNPAFRDTLIVYEGYTISIFIVCKIHNRNNFSSLKINEQNVVFKLVCNIFIYKA